MQAGPIPVTLNCSGGIALGAYMAGVFSELVTACLRPRAGRPETLICIDTITGASAGSFPAAFPPISVAVRLPYVIINDALAGCRR
ncbi:patatin-like phospholipase family protein [Synechococcus sp. CBW1004]|uniref:patatin-like phospholipase family protein n=1 Tax=Synechococcus sp. CBW1004 TaxID=1353136 RepID=UPI0018CEBAD2|nr:patatin-like phospholipase family protein [Synechococcus sp. CBW1004]QPN63293.1 patatin-like phospholipase family protein [Synechococcus sp. CBW1004]